jgi:hypothetical protein
MTNGRCDDSQVNLTPRAGRTPGKLDCIIQTGMWGIAVFGQRPRSLVVVEGFSLKNVSR